MAQPKAKVVGAFGARGTGKTAWLMQELQGLTALGTWDYKNDPRLEGFGKPYYTMPEFIQSLKQDRFNSRYIVDRSRSLDEQFNWYCKAIFQRGNMAAFIDELPVVTKSNRAPDAWRECVNVGREYRTRDSKNIKALSLYATAQRPSECDKSFISQLDVIHTGRLSFANDAIVIAKSIGCRPEEVMHLKDLEWLEKSADSPKYLRGVLSFNNRKTGPKKRP